MKRKNDILFIFLIMHTVREAQSLQLVLVLFVRIVGQIHQVEHKALNPNILLQNQFLKAFLHQ